MATETLYLVKQHKLSVLHKLSSIFQFSFELKRDYHEYLKTKLTQIHTREITFINDRLFFQNKEHILNGKQALFRDFDQEEQNIITLLHFKEQRKDQAFQQPISLSFYEFPIKDLVCYGFILKNVDKQHDLMRFVSMNENDFCPITVDKDKMGLYAFEIPIQGITDKPFYLQQAIPSYIDRLKALSWLTITTKFIDMHPEQRMVLFNQIDDFSFPELVKMFKILNKIMQFPISDEEIDIFFKSHKEHVEKRERKSKLLYE